MAFLMSDHHVVMSNRMPSISYRYVAMSESPFLNAVSPLSGVVSPFGCKPPKYAIVVPALSLWRAATPPWNGTLYCTTPNRTTLQKAPTPSLLSLMVICHYVIAGFGRET